MKHRAEWLIVLFVAAAVAWIWFVVEFVVE